jgi:hypothetical protein
MIIHKVWKEEIPYYKGGAIKEMRVREGWFLFGLFPLFTRTIRFEL